MASRVHAVGLHGLALIALVLAACYEPRYGECVVRCAADSQCAPTHVCGADGWCASAQQAGRCFLSPGDDASVPDADELPGRLDARVVDARPADAGSPPPPPPPPPDAAAPDAPSPACAPGCPGTCQAGVCVIWCTTPYACDDDVVCPLYGPCKVVCSGHESCRDDVICGTGRCTVTCSGKEACRRGVRCEESCACDVECSGIEACKKASRCPDDPCEAGKGCTSQPSGCDDC